MTSPKTRSRFTLANGVTSLAERASHINSASADHLPCSKSATPKYAPLSERSLRSQSGWLTIGLRAAWSNRFVRGDHAPEVLKGITSMLRECNNLREHWG